MPATRFFMPLSLEDTLSHLSPDIAFYSAAGIDCEQGGDLL